MTRRARQDWIKLGRDLLLDPNLSHCVTLAIDAEWPEKPTTDCLEQLIDTCLADALMDLGITGGEINERGRSIDHYISRANRFRLELESSQIRLDP